ncbi:MAG TPA: type II CAAX endopeptidase family protein [Myxococcaceae bacterium]|nr:type II CAAX endopeptidase family protein [Myxococcaceae bacterium]
MPALLRRILLAPIPRLLWTGILALLLGRLVFWISPALMRAPNVTLTGASRNAALTVLVFAAGLWLFERKRPRDAGLGLSGSVSQTSRGFLVGALLLTAVTGVLALTGSYRILGWAPVPDGTTRAALLGRAVLIFLAVGVFEEVASRGIVFRQLEQAIGTWLAIIVSALFFGFGHRNNPGATWVSSVAIAIEAGALLAAAYVATRSLWLPIGLHWAWNLFEGPVWGSPVSGIGLPVIANARFPGPRLLTGGDFGPEAGLPAMVLGAALGVWFLVLAIRRDQIVTPAWMRWLAGRLRRRPELLEPASAPAPVTPSSAG